MAVLLPGSVEEEAGGGDANRLRLTQSFGAHLAQQAWGPKAMAVVFLRHARTVVFARLWFGDEGEGRQYF